MKLFDSIKKWFVSGNTIAEEFIQMVEETPPEVSQVAKEITKPKRKPRTKKAV